MAHLPCAVLITAALAGAAPVAACQCGTIPSAAEAEARSQVVVAGEVLYSHTAPAATAARQVVALRVDRVWKGSPAATVDLLVGRSDCDYDRLERGGSYLVFARFAGGTPSLANYLTASKCLPTGRLSQAAAQLAGLGPGRAVLHNRGGGAPRMLLLVAAGLASLGLGVYVFYLRTR